MTFWWQALRVSDWGVQLLILWFTSALYLAVSGLDIAAYVLHLAIVSLWSVLFLTGGFLINNYCDRLQDQFKADSQRRSLLAPEKMLSIGIICLVGCAAALPIWLSAPATMVVGLLAIVGGLAYSTPWPRLKERGRWGLAAAALLQRIPSFLLLILAFPLRPVAAAALLVWLLVLGLVFILEHQLDDLANDQRAGVCTWATAKGRLPVQLARHRLYWVFRLTSVAAALALMVETPTAAGFLSGLLLVALGFLLEFLAWKRYLSNRYLPRSDDLPIRGTGRRVVIHGGGLAGLMAAIKLADWGWAPEVRESQRTDQGPGSDLVSVHAIRFNPMFLEAYLHCSLAGCFQLVQRETLYLNGRPRTTSGPHWVCKRGKGPGTIDAYLTHLAEARGVIFAQPSGAEDLSVSPAEPSIIATGLAWESYDALDVDQTRLSGYWATAEVAGPRVLLTYLSGYTHPNYGYVASSGGTTYALIFSRRGVTPEALARFQHELEATESLTFETWRPMSGAAPRECQLTSGGYVLAGTLSGMMDPFWYSGVSGALLSGGLAALAQIDPDLARMEHRRFTGNFRGQLLLADLAERLPWRLALGAWVINGVIDPAGSLGRWCRPRRHDATQFPAVELKQEEARVVG